MKTILYINACVRGEESRTGRIARALIGRIYEAERAAGGDARVIERRLAEEGRLPLDGAALAKRSALLAVGALSDAEFADAREFATADEIVIAAPFWDMGFPAVLKVYLERIYAIGIVSRYGEDGVPVGLCRAGRLLYVTTAGGPFDGRYSFDYLSDLATRCFGIGKTELFVAEGLDIDGADVEGIVNRTISEIEARV